MLCIVAVTTFVIANNIPDNEQNTSSYKTTISDVKFKDSKCITFNTCEGDPLHTSLTPYEKFCYAMLKFSERCIGK